MNSIVKILVSLLLGLGLGGTGVWLVLKQPAPHGQDGHGQAEAPAGRPILYWYDPMVPDQHFDKPGKSPFMDMDLVPKYADEAGPAGTVRIDPRTLQNLGVRTAPAEEDRLWRRVDTVGTVQVDENRIRVVQARASGYIERLHVRAVNAPVRRGQPLAEVYSPDLFAAQEEYRLALQHPDDPALIGAARQKLLFLGLAPAQVEHIAAGGPAQRRVVYYAPVSGVVSELVAREGASVSDGSPLMTLSDLSRVWIMAQVPEDQADWIVPGKDAEVRLPSRPGVTLDGKVDYIYPEFNRSARTLQVRIALANPDLALKPGMYAEVTLYGGASAPAVLVPSEAVIATGKRSLVLVAEGQGRFRPAVVKTGMQNDGRTQILAGLQPGEQVVVSGQFLIESEANLKGLLARLEGPEQTWRGSGRITAVNAAEGLLEMAHAPIPAIDWPAMTMPFDVASAGLLEGLKVGQEVDFDLARRGDGYVVVAIHARESAP
ncbi:MAG TPA: efflux RND transporter periplasmic adaptor subunit [Thiobacillaceae bacterium]|nr:efflux RND transporter periplasmic adaptor subunit [Thiobacillaceae bacterium]HNU64903.1 efflux RND transporter periplasmic adaptor subunit [Thiobacillaceae bacterium]